MYEYTVQPSMAAQTRPESILEVVSKRVSTQRDRLIELTHDLRTIADRVFGADPPAPPSGPSPQALEPEPDRCLLWEIEQAQILNGETLDFLRRIVNRFAAL